MATDVLSAAADYRRSLRPSSTGSTRRSIYLPMRDGTHIAIDLHLPRPLGATKLPTILRQTRYFRAIEPRRVLAPFLGTRLDPTNAALRRLFLSHGYAWVDVDVRGSGASFGSWTSPWAAAEVDDGKEILDWNVAQPWSNGKVGSTGNSYDGTAAEMLVSRQHPALAAVALRCSLFDVYADIAFPGGLHQSWFTETWTHFNQSLDRNRPDLAVAAAISLGHPALAQGWPRSALERALKLIVSGVRPVDEAADDPAHALKTAVQSHRANRDVHQSALGINYRDDHAPDESGSVDEFSPSQQLERIRGAGVPVLSISGWWDGAYPHAAIKRHLSLGSGPHRLVLGPWNHGLSLLVEPGKKVRRTSFDLGGELLRFFDLHTKGISTGMEREADTRYYSMGEGSWKRATSWPPPSHRIIRYYLDEGLRLAPHPPSASAGADEHIGEATSGTGLRSRWRTLVSPLVVPDYADLDRRGRIIYRSQPLTEPLSLAGHPLFTLYLKCSAADGGLFVYLEEETAEGRAYYVTEGLLRLIHRKSAIDPPAYVSPAPVRTYRRAQACPMEPGAIERAVVDLLPVAHRFSRGSRLCLSVASGDQDHFSAPPPATIQLLRSRDYASVLELPVE
jgi:hypothetical protein